MQTRRFTLTIIFFILFAFYCQPFIFRLVKAEPLRVQSVPVILNPDDPQRRRFGAMTFLSGFKLRSSDRRFGGLSGLTLSPDGSMLFSVSDRGYALSARLLHDCQGRLIGLRDWTIDALQTPRGQPVRDGLRDAEAIERRADGSFLVAFERFHRIWHYPRLNTGPRLVVTPPDLQQAPSNGGVEAMTLLPDGRIMVLTERYKHSSGVLKGWILDGDRSISISFRITDGFKPTDLALLQGDVLVLERHYLSFFGASIRIRRIKADRLQTGAPLQGDELIHLQSPLNVDNFEGLAVFESDTYGNLIYVISDDNFSPLQKTLLLQFRLDTTALR